MFESMDDPVLGRLEWDDRLQWWVGSIALEAGHEIDVFVVPDCTSAEPAAEVGLARRSFARVQQREPEYRQWSAAQLLTKRWNTEEPMTAADIANLLRVASLEFGPNGVTRIFWNDEDVLFGGHNVVTDLDAFGNCVASMMQ
jgi:hypothetical protein